MKRSAALRFATLLAASCSLACPAARVDDDEPAVVAEGEGEGEGEGAPAGEGEGEGAPAGEGEGEGGFDTRGPYDADGPGTFTTFDVAAQRPGGGSFTV